MIYKVITTPGAEEHLARHIKSGDKVELKKMSHLRKEVELHPRTGTGKPEWLKYYTVETWSRRINGKHRFVYEIDDDTWTVTIISLWGHYDDK
jgi:toxin YoeB